jgi:hypothetical protein
MLLPGFCRKDSHLEGLKVRTVLPAALTRLHGTQHQQKLAGPNLQKECKVYIAIRGPEHTIMPRTFVLLALQVLSAYWELTKFRLI